MAVKLKKFRVTVRHSPMPIKSMVVMAQNEEEALKGFKTANEEASRTKKHAKTREKLYDLVVGWEPEESDVTIQELA